VCHASKEKEAVSTAAAVEPAGKNLDPNAFTTGPTVNYNPLQKKVIVEGLMDTRLSGNTVGSLGNPNLVTGGQGQTRIAFTDDNGQVRCSALLPMQHSSACSYRGSVLQTL
jgi:hypothetical protein